MCVFETVGLGGRNFYVSYAIPSGAYSSYTHDCVDNADSPHQTIADVIDIFNWHWIAAYEHTPKLKLKNDKRMICPCRMQDWFEFWSRNLDK